MTTPDVRAFYDALGVELPGWPKLEAAVRCFAQSDAHNHNDRSPSCSVALASGAWNCHGCGAHGGAYDAALAVGRAPREAMDLLIRTGLAQRRGDRAKLARRTPTVDAVKTIPAKANRPRLAIDAASVQTWADMLDADGRVIRRLILERAWAPRITRALEIGFDGTRITIPIRNARGQLRGILRYDPFGRHEPKMRAVPGTRLGLIPHPASEPSKHIILVEGPPDMIAARSAGLPAVAIPGTSAWRPAWAQLLATKHITVVMDCDAPGRRAANEIAESLERTAEEIDVVDLWPDRNDGYDLTDRILERRRSRPCANVPRTLGSLLLPNPSRHTSAPTQNRGRSTSGPR
jgi:Toprim-like